MKVVTGTTGQLGTALQRCVPRTRDRLHEEAELDLSDSDACREAVQQHQPDWVLNAGAYTAVDQAESEPDMAMAVNAGAPKAFTDALINQQEGKLLQISTDFVFNGEQSAHASKIKTKNQSVSTEKVKLPEKKQSSRGLESATGDSSEDKLGHRTRWQKFCTNNAKTANKEEIGVVADQIASNMYALAEACWRIITINTRKDSPQSCIGAMLVQPAGTTSR